MTQMSFAARRDLIAAAAPQTNLMPLQLSGLAGALQGLASARFEAVFCFFRSDAQAGF